MGTDLKARGSRLGGALALLLVLPTGCGSDDPAANDTDVMYAQMTLAQIDQGRPVLALAVSQGLATDLRAVAAELGTQWDTESATLTGWLSTWEKPAAADPDAGAHAGHGDLHALRSQDVDELRAAEKGPSFDRLAANLLLGHLHNGMETARMEATGGAYPDAVKLARDTTATRQQQIQRLLRIASAQ